MHPEVYDPAEDTFLLIDSLDVTSNDAVYEMGTGTGIIALVCARLGAKVICSDINPYAVKLTRQNIKQNMHQLQGEIAVRQDELFRALSDEETFDLIIFNPPYLPTKKDDLVAGSGWFDKAVDGGESGLNVIEAFLNDLCYWLKPMGRAFIVVSTRSSRKRFQQILKHNCLKSTVVTDLCFTDETIEVHRITKK